MAERMLELIGVLYRIERDIQEQALEGEAKHERRQRLSAPVVDEIIATAGRRGGMPDNERGQGVTGQATAATNHGIRALVDALDLCTMKRLRDRALLLLLVGYDTALTHSELVAIDVGRPVRTPPEGLTMRIPVAKGDQTGSKRAVVALRIRLGSPYCLALRMHRLLVYHTVRVAFDDAHSRVSLIRQEY